MQVFGINTKMAAETILTVLQPICSLIQSENMHSICLEHKGVN